MCGFYLKQQRIAGPLCQFCGEWHFHLAPSTCLAHELEGKSLSGRSSSPLVSPGGCVQAHLTGRFFSQACFAFGRFERRRSYQKDRQIHLPAGRKYYRSFYVAKGSASKLNGI